MYIFVWAFVFFVLVMLFNFFVGGLVVITVVLASDVIFSRCLLFGISMMVVSA